MNLSFKSTASIFALALYTTIPNAFSADALIRGGDGDGSKALLPSAASVASPVSAVASPVLPMLRSSSPMPLKTEERTRTNPSPFLTVDTLRDTYSDSGSMSMHSYGDKKARIQAILSQGGHEETRRMLQLDGGGVRGLFSILELCVLEEIINHPSNQALKERLLAEKKDRLARIGKKDDTNRLYIRDLFDIATGTSTGSILTAALFSEANLSAIEAAKLYTRFGYKIFDEQKRAVMPGLGIGLTNATFDNAGLKKLLATYFNNSLLMNVHKPIYIQALNEHKQEVAIFSSEPMMGDKENLHRTHLVDAVLYSSSAPTFLPGVMGRTGLGDALFSDGGTVANNSAHLVYQKEISIHGNPYEIYSFGTGITPPPVVRAVDTGAIAVAKVLENTLVASEKLALSKCVDEIKAISSQLKYFVRINPILEQGMDRLDDTSEAYVLYAIKKAFSVTLGSVYADMVARLGFKVPALDEMSTIHTRILEKLYALKSKKYQELSDLEKEFVIKKVLGLDFTLYGMRLYEDRATGEIRQMTGPTESDPVGDVGVFLTDLMKDVAVRKEQNGNEFLKGLWSKITTSDEDNILEFIPRCLEFHSFSVGQNMLTLSDLDLLTPDKACEFTQDQLRALSPHHTINGDGRIFSGSAAEESHANRFVTLLFTKFVEYCEKDTAKYKYLDSSSPYAHLPALIFWKNILHNIEGKLTKGQLEKIRANLKVNLAQIIKSRSYTAEWVASIVRSSRHEVLLKGLDTYIEKFHKD